MILTKKSMKTHHHLPLVLGALNMRREIKIKVAEFIMPLVGIADNSRTLERTASKVHLKINASNTKTI